MILIHLPPNWRLELCGSTAAVCTTLSFLPQLLRVWKRKSAHDISLTMFLLFSFGVACWLLYGLGIGSAPIIAANSVTLALALTILALKLHYDRRPQTKTAEQGAEIDSQPHGALPVTDPLK